MTTNNRSFDAEELRLNVMRILELNPGVSQRELARKLGVSLGSINYCVRALIDVGSVKLGNFARSERKIKYAYILTPSGFREKVKMTSRFLERKISEVALLQKEIELLREEMERQDRSERYG